MADAREFVAGLVDEMRSVFAQLGAQETLESESQGQVEMKTLLQAALKSELEASELAGMWMPTTAEIDAKQMFAQQCADEMKHYDLIARRLRELGESLEGFDALAEGYSPLYHYLRGLRTTVERVAGGPFAREAIAEIRNTQFVDYCKAVGDQATAALYETTIGPDETHHHGWGRALLEKYCTTQELQDLAAAAARNTLAIADELRTLTERSKGLRIFPVS